MRAASTSSERSSKWKAASFNQRCAHAGTVKRSRVLRSKVPERDGASSSSKLRLFTARNSLVGCSLRLTEENALVSPCASDRTSKRASAPGGGERAFYGESLLSRKRRDTCVFLDEQTRKWSSLVTQAGTKETDETDLYIYPSPPSDQRIGRCTPTREGNTYREEKGSETPLQGHPLDGSPGERPRREDRKQVGAR